MMATTLTRLPIVKLPTRSHGWHDLSVLVGGGGEDNHFVRLRFDGRRYRPGNPSLAVTTPAALLRRGRVIIPAGR